MQFEVRTREQEGWTVVEVAGEVDIATAPDLRGALEEVREKGAIRIVIDLEGVTFMDSSGLEVLVGASKGLEERGGRLALVCEDGPVHRVLRITGLDKGLDLYPSVDQAIA